MITITAEDLEKGEAEAAEARQALQETERAYGMAAQSTGGYEARRAASERADHAETRLKVLRDDYAAQQAERDRRAAAGEAAAQELAPEVKELVKSQQAAVKAVVAAAAAMGKALAALDGHDAAVRALGAELGKRGLRSVDGEETGVSRDGAAWIEGKLWPLVDSVGVLGQLLADEVASRHPRHPLTRQTWRPYGGTSAGRGRDEVLDAVRAVKGR